MNTTTLAHSSDPTTSHEAASQVDPHDSTRLKLALIDLLAESPRTADELTDAYYRLGVFNRWPQITDRHNIKRRLSELHTRHHVIRESGDRRPSAMGRPATVWELTKDVDAAREAVNA